MFCEFASCHKIVASPKTVLIMCPKIVCEFGPTSISRGSLRGNVVDPSATDWPAAIDIALAAGGRGENKAIRICASLNRTFFPAHLPLPP